MRPAQARWVWFAVTAALVAALGVALARESGGEAGTSSAAAPLEVKGSPSPTDLVNGTPFTATPGPTLTATPLPRTLAVEVDSYPGGLPMAGARVTLSTGQSSVTGPGGVAVFDYAPVAAIPAGPDEIRRIDVTVTAAAWGTLTVRNTGIFSGRLGLVLTREPQDRDDICIPRAAMGAHHQCDGLPQGPLSQPKPDVVELHITGPETVASGDVAVYDVEFVRHSAADDVAVLLSGEYVSTALVEGTGELLGEPPAVRVVRWKLTSDHAAFEVRVRAPATPGAISIDAYEVRTSTDGDQLNTRVVAGD